nr:PREDICTED: prolactin regulatory element-binding protein isoform X2 [Latimeria chalumnae]XP_014345542.1 PREDICTED: prolactin regulatory element-binding protein isoform X2 [Latimeria chalumnae]|eukprot:XP_005998762.1 PREDICTED: prolactin regulatory element-binding protein isoform X2 [Latimeria chalumnae]
MSMALAGDIIAAGQDASCHILRYHEAPKKQEKKAGKKEEKKEANDKGPRKRKSGKGAKEDGGGDTYSETAELVVETLKVVQSDFSEDRLQKAVRFNKDKTILVTGGVDGFIRVWEFPEMKKTFDFKAHDGEIEDLDIGPDNKIVTVGHDFSCCVWKRGLLAMGLRWNENMPNIPDKMYRYQACRFAKVEDSKDALRLFTVQVPHKRERKPPPCYITKWNGDTFLPLLTQPCGNEVISCLAVSDSGTFLGLGTVTGSVAIYIAFSLQKLYYVKEAHGIVVTEVAFLPETRRGRELIGDNEAAMLSVAVDSRCKLHLIPNRQLFPIWLVLLLCALMIVVVILLLQYAFPEFL